MGTRRIVVVLAAIVAGLASTAQGALVGYWTFDGNADDQSGSGNDATVYGGATYGAGQYGQALSLDGLSGYAMAPDSPSLRIGPYTVSVWVRPLVNPSGDPWTGIVGKPGRNYNIWLGNSNQPAGGFAHQRWHDNAGTSVGPPDAYTVPMGAWTHIAIVNDGSVGRTYINGVELAQGSVTGSLIVDNTDLYIGRDLDGLNQRYFLGSIDDVAVWNAPLQPFYVESLANGTWSPAQTAAPRGSLVAYDGANIGGSAYAQDNPGDPVQGPVHWKLERLAYTAPTIAYIVPAGTDGNQTHGGPLGMEFDTTSEIIVTELGVFDDDSNGLSNSLQVRLYDRTDPSTPLAVLDFSPSDPGTLVDGSRFKPLATPLVLPAGFQGCIVADGYGGSEENGNGMGGAVPWTTDSGGGALSFVGDGLWGPTPGTYPTNVDGGPANRYAAGTFVFMARSVTELLAEGYYNVGGPDDIGIFYGIGDRPGEEFYVRLTIEYAGEYLILEGQFMGVPEPASLVLLAGGLIAVARRRRRPSARSKRGGPFTTPFRKERRAMGTSRGWVVVLMAGMVLASAGAARGALISYWSLDDAAGSTAAANLVPGGPVATLRNMDPVTSWVGGRFGGALDFTAVDDYLDVLLNSVCDIPETGVTVSLWFRTTSADGGLFSLNNPERGGENDRNVWVAGGSVRGRVWHQTGEETVTNTPPAGSYADGAWHHVVHQYGPGISGQRVYVDGQVPPASGTRFLSGFDWRTHAQIGWANQGGSFNGQIDDVAIWDHLLSESEIQALANGTSSPGDSLNVPHARLVSGTVGSILGAAYAQNVVTGEIAGPVTWQLHKMEVTTGSAVAYVVPAGQTGNQNNHQGSLGMDFDTTAPITVTSLGVFDDDSDGLNRTIVARLYDRTAPGTPLATLTFSPSEPGTLVDGSRFKSLETPLVLPAGFQGRMVAEGYGAGEENGNWWFAGSPPWTTDDGGGTLAFVGTSYYGDVGTYPTSADSGPANRYAAGTFIYDYETYTVGELIAEGNYNVGDDLNDALLWYLGNMPGEHYLRLSVQYGGAEVFAYAWVTGVPEPATCLLLGAGLLALARRRKARRRRVAPSAH